MFTAILFMVAKKGKQPKYPSTGEQINKTWSSHPVGYDLAIKRNQVLTHATTWQN